MFSLARTTSSAPSVEPVTVKEAQDWLRVDYDDDVETIRALIKAARQHAEVYTERAFINQTLTYSVDCFWGSDVLHLPRPPLSSVSSITYVDTDGNTQTVSSSIYSVDTDSEPGRVYRAYSQTWPTPRQQRNAVTVTYVAGYGSSKTNVPDAIRTAIKMMVADMYENREVQQAGALAMNVTAMRLLDAYRVPEGA